MSKDLSKLEITDATMVKGGTPSMHSNRMKEPAASLSPVPEEIAEKYDFLDCEGLEEISIMLQEMVNLEYHLVGTRQYVYSSYGMLKCLEQIMKLVEETDWQEPLRYSWGLFTRTHGLREAIVGTLLRMSKDKGVHLGGK
jgi:hypothetical protein